MSKSTNNFRRNFGWFRLLFKSRPQILDCVLLIVGVIAAIGAGVPFPLLGIIFGQLINNLNSSTCDTFHDTTSGISNQIRTKVLDIIYLTIANFVLIYLYTACWSLFGERLVRRLRRDYFKSLVRQDATFFDRLGSGAGDVASRLVTDIDAIQTGTSEKVGLFIASVSYFVVAYIVAFTKAPVIAGMLVSAVPAFLLMALVGGHYVTKYTRRMTPHMDAATSVASSSLSNMPLVLAFGAQRRLVALFANHLSKTKQDGVKKALSQALQTGCLYFIAYSTNALAFWEGSREIASAARGSSKISVGDVYTVIFVLLDASFIVSQVAPFLHIFHAAGTASARLEETISRRSGIDGTIDDGQRTFSLSTEHISFHDVSFAYPGRPELPALRNINVKFAAGKSTAIVGASGSGKSTITALLERLYDPDTGGITVGRADLRDVNVHCLRSKIGFVEQSAPLLDRSILENVAYGLLGSNGSNAHALRSPSTISSISQLVDDIRGGVPADQAINAAPSEVQSLVRQVRAALAMAHATEFLQRLPEGLATQVGSSASQLSGGQRQRIVLARALIREPELLILDEATASLDSTSERLIQSAIALASEGRTVVTIAHRLATIQQADKIVVIQDGSIIEEGDHFSLLQNHGAYAQMVSAQNVGSQTEVEGSEDVEDETSQSTKQIGDPATWSMRASSDGSRKSSTTTIPAQYAENSPQSPTASPQAATQQRGIARQQSLFSFLRPYWQYILIGLLASIIVGGSYSAEAVLFGQTVTRLSTCNSSEGILVTGRLFGLLFFVLGLVELIAFAINGSSFGFAAAKSLFRARKSTLGSLLHQSLGWHTAESRSPGTLLSIITSDASALGNLTGTTVGIIMSTSVNMVAGIILAHLFAWKIAIVLLATIPVLLATGAMRIRVLAQFHERHQKQFARSSAITLEAVENIKMVAALSLEESIYIEFNESLRGPYQATLKAIAHSTTWLALSFSFPNLVYALGFWWGGKQISAGHYTQTEFFTVLPALLFSTQACSQMWALAPDLAKSRGAISHVLELINAGPEAETDESDKVQDPEKGMMSACLDSFQESHTPAIGLTFKDVHFSYPSRSDHSVLRGLDLCVEAGQFVALVGPSGQGKSTVLNLIEGFYQPSRGSILVDHTNIASQTSNNFRDLIAYVPQSSVLFHGTIAFNLGLGARPNKTASPDDIEHACRLVGIHDLIKSLPDGYNTYVTSNAQFSGGQRQRLCIARALVRKPALLLLDESTSALDTESEMQIQESLERVRQEAGVSILAIAHRLNTIMGADKIFWIEHGTCAYSGTHQELVEHCEGYRINVGYQKL